MSKRAGGVRLPTLLGLLAIALGVVGVSPALPAIADTDNFGHAVYGCAKMMLPYDVESRGAVTMTMPDGSTMHWRNFGEMVTYMRAHEMCS